MLRHVLPVCLGMLASTPALGMPGGGSLLTSRAPSALGASARAQANGYRGMLLGGSARFDGIRLAQAPTPPPPPPSYDEAPAVEPIETTQPEGSLEQEYAQLEANVPGLLSPILLTAGGIGGLYLGYLAALIGAFSNATALAIAGALVAVGGVVMMAVGTVLTVMVIVAKVQRMRRMNEIQELLKQSPQAPAAMPLPPAMVRWEGSRLTPQVALARF